MKKLISVFLCCVLLLTLVGCAGTTVVVGECTCPPESHNPATVPADSGLKTGLAIVPNLEKSASATAEAEGKADFDVTVVAVIVDENGMIWDCVIDSLGASSKFNAAGVATAPGTQEVKTKNEKGYDYGMAKVSAIGKEWFEQAEALAAFAVGRTLDEVKAGINGGYAADVDLVTSATIYLGGYVRAMEAAVANAKPLGADSGDELKLAVTATIEAGEGAVNLTVDAAALTRKGDVVTSCTMDSLQTAVTFDGTGTITSELTAPKTKMQKGAEYGMAKFSSIGKEWSEQAEFFCDYITGKTLTEVANISVDEGKKPVEVDLTTGCTISIGGFQSLIAKAAD